MKLSLTIIICLLVTHLAISQTMMRFEEKRLPDFQLKDPVILKFCSEQPAYKQLNKEEGAFYYWVNYSRKNPRKFYDSVIQLITALYPQLKGEYLTSLKTDLYNAGELPLLNLSQKLIKLAKSHANDITSHNAAPAHNSTNGATFLERFREYIHSSCGAENISYGGDNPVFLLTLLYLDINTPTLGHRKNLLSPKFTETGIGNSIYKDGFIFLVQDFACRFN